MSLLEVQSLSVSFRIPSGTVQALTDVSFQLDEGEMLVVIGESGSGKTVLAHSLMRLLPMNTEIQGRMRLGEVDLLRASDSEMRSIRAHRMALIPQGASGALNPVRKLGPLMLEIARGRGLSRQAATAEITSVLAELDLDFEQLSGRYPHQLSGGMQQRVVNAIAMVGSPSLVLADEPTYGLDSDLVNVTAEQLKRIQERGAALLVITHDLRLAERLGGRVGVIYASHLVELSRSSRFFPEPGHPYSKALLGAMPEHGGRTIPGLSPELTALPHGCVFAPRCEHVMAECTTAMPSPYPISQTGDLARCYLHADS